MWVTSNQAPVTNLMGGAEKWEPNTTGFNFEPAATVGSRDLYANNKNFGASGWTGLFRDYNNIDALPACIDNRWSNNAMVSINNNYNPTNSTRRMATATHEFGHYLGLGHENAAVACPAGGVKYLAIMASTAASQEGACAIFTPQADDINGINYLF